MTIFELAVQEIRQDMQVGLGSGRASSAFIRRLGERVRDEGLRIRGVPTSQASAKLAREVGVPLISLEQAGRLDITVDGADEVDPQLNLIKGYGRALVREKVVASSSKRLIILVGTEKLVERLGGRGRLPIEIVPFALPLCERRLPEFGLTPTLWRDGDKVGLTDNDNYILDCALQPIDDVEKLDSSLLSIPGVVGTGLFPGMANEVLIGDPEDDFKLVERRQR